MVPLKIYYSSATGEYYVRDPIDRWWAVQILTDIPPEGAKPGTIKFKARYSSGIKYEAEIMFDVKDQEITSGPVYDAIHKGAWLFVTPKGIHQRRKDGH